ncbi:MAG: peptidoglycan-binding protein [Pseudomonadota bacterium]
MKSFGTSSFRRILMGAAFAAAAYGPAVADFDQGVEAFKSGQIVAAVDTWRLFAIAGDVQSKKILGDIYSGAELEDIPGARAPEDMQDKVEALKWYTLAAFHQFGPYADPSAPEMNAKILAQGRMDDVRFLMSSKDVASAEKLVSEAFEAGSPYDLYHLGKMYQSGRGVAKNNARALLFYRLAANRGIGEASLAFEQLEPMLDAKENTAYAKAIDKWQPPLPTEHTGKTKQQEDLEKTKKELTALEMAKALDATADIDVQLIQQALNILGYRAGAADNDYGPQTREAVRRFQSANKFQVTGEITPKQKVKLIEGAAKFGHPLSQYVFGVMNARGIGLTINGKEAVKWLNKAANEDIAVAHYALGVVHRDGIEGPEPVQVNLQKSAFHLAQSVTLGYTPASEALEELKF